MSSPRMLERLKLRVHVELALAHSLDEQLAALVQIMAEVVNAERATLFLHDPSSGELYSRVAMGVTTGELRVLCHEGVAGAVFTSGASSIINDVKADPRFSAHIDEVVGFTTRSLLAVPLRTADGVTMGVTEAVNKREGGFGDGDLRLMEALTAEAALVLRNTLRLEDAVSASRREARFVEVVSEVSSEIKLGPLLQRIMAAVTRLLDAERSTLFLNDEKTSELWSPRSARGSAPSPDPPAQPPRASPGAVFTSGKSINIPLRLRRPALQPEFDKQTGFFTRSILCVPVVNKEGKIDRRHPGAEQARRRRSRDEDESRLRAFTAQISIALENAKLFDDVQNMKNYSDAHAGEHVERRHHAATRTARSSPATPPGCASSAPRAERIVGADGRQTSSAATTPGSLEKLKRVEETGSARQLPMDAELDARRRAASR